MKNRKKLIIIIIVILLMILLIPIKNEYWDGGTVEYKSLLYKITNYHILDQNYDDGYNDGLKIEVLGFTIYNNFIENVNQEISNEKLAGKWIADGTQDKVIKEIIDGKPVYIGNYSAPSYLYLNLNGTYYLETNNEFNMTESGKYNIKNNGVSFISNSTESDMNFAWKCELKNDNELHCDQYASIFKRSEEKNIFDNFYNDSLTKGYISIEKLSQDYSLEQATKDNAVVVNNIGIVNPDLLDDFKVNINTDKPAFLRLVETTIEGDLIITDIKYGNDKVIVITDNTRDEFSSKEDRKIVIDEYKHIEEVFDFSKDPVVSSLIVYNDNKDNSRVLLTENRLID